MLGPWLVLLERRFEVEDRAPALDRGDAARGEALAVARAVDLIEDGGLRIARAQEVGVEGVRRVALDRASGGGQRLAEHLPAEDALRAFLRAAAAEQVHLQLFEIEDPEQRVERLGHARLSQRNSQSVARRRTRRRRGPNPERARGRSPRSCVQERPRFLRCKETEIQPRASRRPDSARVGARRRGARRRDRRARARPAARIA